MLSSSEFVQELNALLAGWLPDWAFEGVAAVGATNIGTNCALASGTNPWSGIQLTTNSKRLQKSFKMFFREKVMSVSGPTDTLKGQRLLAGKVRQVGFGARCGFAARW